MLKNTWDPLNYLFFLLKKDEEEEREKEKTDYDSQQKKCLDKIIYNNI